MLSIYAICSIHSIFPSFFGLVSGGLKFMIVLVKRSSVILTIFPALPDFSGAILSKPLTTFRLLASSLICHFISERNYKHLYFHFSFCHTQVVLRFFKLEPQPTTAFSSPFSKRSRKWSDCVLSICYHWKDARMENSPIQT